MLQLSKINVPKVEERFTQLKEELKLLIQEREFCKESLIALNEFRWGKEYNESEMINIPVKDRERFMKEYPYMGLYIEKRKAFEIAFKLSEVSASDLEEKIKVFNDKILALEKEIDFFKEAILVLREYRYLGSLKDREIYKSPTGQVQVKHRFMTEYPYLALYLGEQKSMAFVSKYEFFSLFGPFEGKVGGEQRPGYAGQKQEALPPTVMNRIDKFYSEFKVEDEVKESEKIESAVC